MRQLTKLPSADTAQTLSDYLLTLHIDTKLEQQPEGWIVWVRDEDQLERARQELDEFTRHPNDARYTAAPRTAEALRRQQQHEETAYHRRQNRFNRRMSGPIASQRWTVALIVVCVLVSLLSEGGSWSSPVVQNLSFASYLPMQGGAVLTPGVSQINHGEVWRLVTPILIHFSIWHLLFNMFMLNDLGGIIERRRGPLRYLSLVLAVAVISNLVQYYFGHPVWDGVEVKWYHLPTFGGMSGVVYGLFGYIWMKARFHPELGLRIHPSAVVYLMVWFVLCFTPVIRFITGSYVANGAHAGGLIAGMILGYVPILWHSRRSD
jgi:GlpG protein